MISEKKLLQKSTSQIVLQHQMEIKNEKSGSRF